jgi:hypothetical protein
MEACGMKRALVGFVVLALIVVASAQQKYTGAQHAVANTFTALSATGSTPWIWVGDTAPSKHAIQLLCTSTPTIAGNLEGSLDGVNATTIVAASTTCGATAWETTGAKPVMWVRFTLTTLTGGTNPTVTPIYLGSN